MSDKSILFLTDAQGRKTHAVMPIETYNALIELKKMFSNAAPLTEHELYSLSIKNVKATGYPDGTRSKPRFIIVKGSQAVLETVGSLPEHIKNYRENLLGNGTLTLDAEHNCFSFSTDIEVKSPSFAAAIISGNVRNGLDVWQNREGFSLKESGFGKKLRKK